MESALKHRWELANPDPESVESLGQEFRLSPLAARCLVVRGVASGGAAETFLNPRLQRLEDPFALPDMGPAVQRLHQARERGEAVVLYGDYDVDGVTATAILQEALSHLGWQVSWFLPDRFEEGYGLSHEGIEKCLHDSPAKLLLAVDCGSSSARVIESVQARGLDVLVLDHHQLDGDRPHPVALVNPHVHPRGVGRDLCSAGLAFKLIHALVKQGRDLGLPAEQAYDIRSLLDLVALGTVADLVPLTGENRILVCAGLKRLDTTRRPGLIALREVAGVKGPLRSDTIAYQLAPRLNAAGRMEHAQGALELVLAGDLSRAQVLARILDECNEDRRATERQLVREVTQGLQERFDPASDWALVEAGTEWHPGVVGIVASRIMRRFHRPTFILGDGGEGLFKGSGRSIEGFHLSEALARCSDLLESHGGHAMAAGLTVRSERLPALRERLNEEARTHLREEDLVPRLRLDAEATLSDLSLAGVQELERLHPFGQGNPPVHLLLRGLELSRPATRMGQDGRHVRLDVAEGGSRGQVLWWGAEDAPLPEGRFDLACTAARDEWRGEERVRMTLLDWRPAISGAPFST